MAQANQDAGEATETTVASPSGRSEGSAAELPASVLSAAELRVAAQKLSQILTAADVAALDRLRKRRLGRDDLAIEDLIALRGVLMELARLVEGGSVEAWARLAEAREALSDDEEPPGDLEDEPSAGDGDEHDPTPPEPERLDRPAAGPPPARFPGPSGERSGPSRPGEPAPSEPGPADPLASAVAPPRPDNAPSLQMSAEEAVRLARRASRAIEEPAFYGPIEPVNEDTPLRPARRAVPLPFPSDVSGVDPLDSALSRLPADESRPQQAHLQPQPSPQPAPMATEPARDETARTRPILRDDDTIAVMGLPPRDVLPFVSARRDRPAESDAATRFFGFSSLAHPLALTVEEYAGLCAERDVRPAARRQTEERYGIHDAPTREAVDRLFQIIFAGDRGAYAAWEDRYEHFSRVLSR